MADVKINDKLELYGKKVPGISAYANGWLFLLIGFSLWQFVGVDLLSIPLYDVAIMAGYLSLVITAAITIRTPDKTAYIVNLVFLCYLAAYYIYQTLVLFTATAATAGALTDAVGGNSVIASGVALGSSIVTGATVLGGLFALTPVLFFCIFYVGVFVSHRKFFLVSAKEMHKELAD